ncbi:MAG: DegQ family serine endoprotease [Terracidiphilus sp.]
MNTREQSVTTSTRRPLGWLLALILLCLLVGGILRAGIFHLGWNLANVGHAPGHQVALRIAQDEAPVSLGEFKNGFATVIDPALPAVVNISSTKVVRQQNVPNVFNDPFFQQFFGNQPGAQQQQPQTEREHSLGSGVIVNPDGYILTNNHVVAGASDVEVFTTTRKQYRADVIGTDPRTDIAVLKIDASGLPSFTLGDSSKLKVGDLVFAIGDPFGIGETATTGIVSATGRALGGALEHYEDFIQTDAAINPGNSGGALIDLRGNLIGINTAILSGGSGGNQGIGFAIPVNMARNVMEQIVEHGKVTRGYLGVTIQAVDPEMAKAFGLSQGGGALIGDVSPGGPAAKAGLERGDVVLQLNSTPVTGPDDLSLRVSEMAPGAVAHLQVYRNGHTQPIDVTLGTYPENAAAGRSGQGPSTALEGLQVQNLTSDLAQQLGMPPGMTGVFVTDVDPSSPAAAAGVQRGDVIQEVNRKQVHNIAEYQQALAGAGKQPVLLLLNRRGTTLFVVVGPQ